MKPKVSSLLKYPTNHKRDLYLLVCLREQVPIFVLVPPYLCWTHMEKNVTGWDDDHYAFVLSKVVLEGDMEAFMEMLKGISCLW